MQLFVDDFLYRHHRYTRQDAEDLAQDVHIECWKGKAHFRGEARFKTWLDMVALNACVRFLRQARKDCLVCENEMGEVPLACLIDKERQEREKALRQRQERCDDLSRLFSCMTPHQRQVVCWKHIEGLSCRQIASRLGLREQSVRATLHYTLQALKKKSSGEKDPLS